MKYDGEIETYRFIGDSTENKAKRMVKGEATALYTQTNIIDAFNDNKSLICGGSKLFTGKDDPRLGYIVYFGKDRFNPEQIIKIILDKENLEKGDVNALAIDNLCQYSIRVNKKNNKKLAVAAIASALAGIGLAGAIVGGMIWADKKESKDRNQAMQDYQRNLQEQRMEEGTYKSWLEEQGLIDESSIDEDLNEQSMGRSF